MKDNLNFNVAKEYKRLEQRIAQTADMLEQIVAGQKGSIKLQYVRRTLFLCLVRQTNARGECSSVRWAKAEFCEEDKRTWFNGWKPGAVPGSVVKKMDPDGRARFRGLDKIACKVCDLRKELTSKKKRILGTFQSVRQTNDPKLRQLAEEVQNLSRKPGVEAGPGIKAEAAPEPAVSPAHREQSVPDTRTEDLAGNGPGYDLKKEPRKPELKPEYNQGGLSGPECEAGPGITADSIGPVKDDEPISDEPMKYMPEPEYNQEGSSRPESQVEQGVSENKTGPAVSDDLQEHRALKYGLYFKDDQEGSSCPESQAEQGLNENSTGPVEDDEAEVFLAEDEDEICLAEDDAFDIGGELFEEDF